MGNHGDNKNASYPQPPRDQPSDSWGVQPQYNLYNNIYNNDFANSVQASSGNVNSFGPNSTQYGAPQASTPRECSSNDSPQPRPTADFRQAGSCYQQGTRQSYSSYGYNGSPNPLDSQTLGKSAEPRVVETSRSNAIRQVTAIEIFAKTGDRHPWEPIKALRDNATTLNWISRKVVNRLKLPKTGGLVLESVMFNGETLKSFETVTATWSMPGGSESYENEFWVAENPPFDVLFGYNFLNSYSKILDADADPACVLAQGKITESERGVIEENRGKAEKEEAHLEAQSQKDNNSGKKSSGDKMTSRSHKSRSHKASGSSVRDSASSSKRRDNKEEEKRRGSSRKS